MVYTSWCLYTLSKLTLQSVVVDRLVQVVCLWVCVGVCPSILRALWLEINTILSGAKC